MMENVVEDNNNDSSQGWIQTNEEQTVDNSQGIAAHYSVQNAFLTDQNNLNNNSCSSNNTCGLYIQTVSQYGNTAEEDMINYREPGRPPPPIVDKVTHHTIDLYWEDAIKAANEESPKGGGKIKVCLQEEDKNGSWGNIYSGYGKRHTVMMLEPLTQYHFRMRFMNNYGNSEWSPQVAVTTTKEPLSGVHLHKAIGRKDVDEIKKILETGDVKIDVPDDYGFTGLMQASQKGYNEIVKILLEYGAEVGARNQAGKTALMLACFAGQSEVVETLRKAGARYDDFDRGGTSPLHWAVDGQNFHLIDWMIRDGADVNVRDKGCGWTPLLRCAAVNGKREVANILLINGADINVQDNDHKTALMIAIINGHFKLVDLLLKRGADLTIKNEYGKTAYNMAVSMEKRTILQALDEHIETRNIKGVKI